MHRRPINALVYEFVCFCCLLLFSDFLRRFCISFFHGDGQSSLGIVNLDLDLDVLYQISFFKKECEHLHAAFSCRNIRKDLN